MIFLCTEVWENFTSENFRNSLTSPE